MELKSESFIRYIVISVLSATFGLYSSIYFIRKYRFQREFYNLKRLRDARILQKKNNLREFESYLNKIDHRIDDVDKITNKSFTELINLLQIDEKARNDILIAFQKKAFDVNSRLNCVVDFINVNKSEINFNGPLAGLPVSLKDNFLVKDYFSCAGCSYFLNKPSSSNCVLVDVIKQLGGVPFVKTTVPQSMMSFLSSNPIDGITLNPIDASKSPGGSSSGEAALIGGRGSIVGIGTDMGGSIRIPAAFCGIVGLKPTNGRLSKKGLLPMMKYSIINGVCGVLGRDVDAVTYLFEQITNSQFHRQLDPTVVPIDFNRKVFQSTVKLKIGYFIFDESYRCVPAIERAVLETIKRLEKNGHQIIRWKPPISGEKWLELFLRVLSCDRIKEIRSICRYDKKDFTIRNLYKLFELNYFQYLIKLFQATLDGNNESIIWLKATRGISSGAKLMDALSEIKRLREMILEDWQKLDIDMVVCPPCGFTAVPLKPVGSLTGMLSYENLWNLVDFPAGTVPVSKVTQDDVTNLFKNYPKELSPWHFNTFTAQKDSLNMPISVQCVARPWKEEICLRIMKELQQ